MKVTWGLLTVLSLVCHTESRCSPTSYYKNCWIRRFPGIFIDIEESQRRGAQLLKYYQEETALKCSRTCCLTRNCELCSLSCVKYTQILKYVVAATPPLTLSHPDLSSFLLQFPVIWPYFTMMPLKKTWTASTCTVQLWRAVYSATEATLFCTISQRVSTANPFSTLIHNYAVCGYIYFFTMFPCMQI